MTIKTLDLTKVTAVAPPLPEADEPNIEALMPEPVQIPRGLKKYGKPERTSIYRHVDGAPAFAVVRFPNKKIYPIVYADGEFISRGYPAPRPLYNADVLAAHPDWPVLVVEGEKAAEDGAQYLPGGWCITTWAGGTNAIDKTDWATLAGRCVVVWPDNDEVGLKAARKICGMLGASCAMVSLSDSYPAAWDLADSLPDGVGPVDVLSSIMEAYAATHSAEKRPSPVLPDAEITQGGDDGFIDEHLLFRALGYDDAYYYVMPAKTGVILKMTAREVMSAAGCLRIINDINYWLDSAPAGKGSVDWTLAGSRVMWQCEQAGYYDERRLRGRGVWMDEKRVVVNVGEALVVDGSEVNPVKVRSRFIYKKSEALFAEGYDFSDEAGDAEGRTVIELCNAPMWDKPVHGDLLAGWIATSLVCGALHWRTHIWVTGNAGSGKSTVINRIASACVGETAIYPMGETTESGIRQHIGNDARPVIFDEMEGTDAQRVQNDGRRQAIIQLMRMASSESLGRIMKGSASHKGVAFTMRSSFLVASIGMSLKEAPDLTRTLVLSLRPLPSDATMKQREEAEERYAQLNRLAAKLPNDISQRLFARQTRLVNIIRKNADTFREVIAEELGNRRLGDQVGTLLAGRCSLTSDKEMTRDECLDYVRRFEWQDVIVTPADREDRQLMNHLKQTIVRTTDKFGKAVERAVGELIDIAFGMRPDDELPQDATQKALMRFGIRVDRVAHGLYLSARNEELNKLFRNSTNPVDWYSVVARNPMAERAPDPIRFAGASTAAIYIPKGEWCA